MTIENPTPKTPEELEIEEKEKREALCAQYAELIQDCEKLWTPPADLRESGPEIAEFESMVLGFEKTYSIADLHSIVDLTQDDAPSHPVREPAKIAVGLISDKLGILKRQTDITQEKLRELAKKYERLSRAVGVINNGKVDHNREVKL